jgi:membrane-associated protease RseP (regulator of RpoE activity)
MISIRNRILPSVAAMLIAGASVLAAQTAPSAPQPPSPSEQPAPAPEATAYAYVVESSGDDAATGGSGEDSETSSNRNLVWVGPEGKHFSVQSFQGRRAYLGVGLVQITSDLRRHFGAPASAGVLISEIADGSPAAASRLEVGDVLTAIDGKPVKSKWDAVQKIATHAKGDSVELRIYRGGKPLTVRATLAETTRPSFNVTPFLLHGGKGGAYAWRSGDSELHVAPPEVNVEAPNPERVIEIRKEAIDRAMKELNEKLESPEFRARLQAAQERSAEIEKRTSELEARLEKMQSEIEAKQKVQSRQLERRLQAQARELERKQRQIDRLQGELDTLRRERSE